MFPREGLLLPPPPLLLEGGDDDCVVVAHLHAPLVGGQRAEWNVRDGKVVPLQQRRNGGTVRQKTRDKELEQLLDLQEPRLLKLQQNL